MDRKYLTWDEIKKEYPDMWVSLIEPEYSKELEFLGGFVITSDKDKNTALAKTKKIEDAGLEFKTSAFYYTGQIPYLVGITRMVLSDVQAKAS